MSLLKIFLFALLIYLIFRFLFRLLFSFSSYQKQEKKDSNRFKVYRRYKNGGLGQKVEKDISDEVKIIEEK
jgi:hypothetical protein